MIIRRLCPALIVTISILAIAGKNIGLDDMILWTQVFHHVLAANLFLCILKMLRLLTFNRHIGVMASTMRKMVGPVMAFELILGIIFMAYTFAGVLMFSKTEQSFKSFLTGIQTLFSMSLGMVHFKGTFVQLDSSVVSQFFFLSFVTLVIFISMNILMAVINDSYAAVVDQGSYSYDKELVDHIWGKFMKWCRSLEKMPWDQRKEKGKPPVMNFRKSIQYREAPKKPNVYVIYSMCCKANMDMVKIVFLPMLNVHSDVTTSMFSHICHPSKEVEILQDRNGFL